MDLDQLRQDARDLINPNMDSSEYPDTLLDRNINQWYQRAINWAMKSQSEWQVKGDILTTNTTKNKTDYSVPDNLLRVYKGEIKYESGGDYVTINPYSVENNPDIVEGGDSRDIDDESEPTVEVFGDYLQIRPSPDESVTNGLKIWAQLAPADLDKSQNIVIPDLPTTVHRILSIGAAKDFCLSNEMYDKHQELRREIYGMPNNPDDGGLKADLESREEEKSGHRKSKLRAQKSNYH